MFTLNRIPEYKPVGRPYYLPILSGKLLTKIEPELTISGYIDAIYYQRVFLKAMYYILVEKESFGVEGAVCYYPDEYSYDFEGVEFEVGGTSYSDYQVNVSENVCFYYLKIACERFLELHPEIEYKNYLENILNNWEPLNKDDI